MILLCAVTKRQNRLVHAYIAVYEFIVFQISRLVAGRQNRQIGYLSLVCLFYAVRHL